MSNWPLNAEALQGIARTTFYDTLALEESQRLYNLAPICQTIQQTDLTTTYTSFGEVPEPRQLSGTVASTGERQAYGVKDYKITGTVVEWEQTIEMPRAVVETNPAEVTRKIAQMARAASMFMDRRLVATVLPAATAGYDGVALISASHPESGTNQDNDLTATAGTGTKPSAAELESTLDIEIGTLKKFTGDRGTPVNEGVSEFVVLCPVAFEGLYKQTLELGKGQAIQQYDASGATGRYRGMFQVRGSAFVATDDRHYLFAKRAGTSAVALLRNKDFEFVTNIGTDSDMWRLKQMAVFSSYARFEFIPWDWKCMLLEVWT